MSRSLVLGNGSMLLCFDNRGQVRDFYFPYVGLENHIAHGDVHKIGIWTEGGFSWLSDEGWSISVDYKDQTMASSILAVNTHLGVELQFTDIVYNEKNIFVRSVVVKNNLQKKRVIKLFFNQQFQISETTHADTAYYNPSVGAVIHYKGRRIFLIGGQTREGVYPEFSIGLFKIEGKEGTWRDAEDGILEKNPIEHGSVDSTIGFTFTMEPGEEDIAEYWIAASETFREASLLQEYILKKTPGHLLKSTQDFWKAWTTKFRFTFYGLPENVIKEFERSLLIIRTHCDNNGGILASGDSDNFRYGRDTYAYVWPRDAAFVALALDKAGYFDIPKRFYEFANEVITDDGYLLHKYQADKSFGSSWHPWIKNGKSQLAIQEDETALLLYGLWEHYQKTRDLEFVESVYNSFIKKAGDFMVTYKEKLTGRLPQSSYDLWEERNGISAFTSSSVYAGLIAASQFAELLGKEDESRMYSMEAESMRQAIVSYFWNDKTQFFDKQITITENEMVKDSTIDLASFYGIFAFKVLEVNDPMLIAASETAKKILSDPIPAGGYARYTGDTYYEVSKDVPGNPWFITTLWMTRYSIARAKTESDLESAKKELSFVVEKAFLSGILSEQIHPITGEPLSVAPLTWSHAEFVLAVVSYLEKLEELGVCSVCYPVK